MTTVSNLKHNKLVRKVVQISLSTFFLCTLMITTLSAAETDGRWHEIKTSLFGDRAIQNGEDVIGLETPYRALDAAVVPISIESKIAQSQDNYIKSLYLVIDNNPSPIAAIFHFPGKHNWQSLSTRVRVNAYTDLRVIAEISDGNIYMVNNYVKASGGCSAPSLKDPAAAAAHLGKIKLKLPKASGLGDLLSTQLLIKHPNSSRLQFDQISRQYIPANFIRSIQVTFNDEVVFTADSDISISEDPSIHFGFRPEEEGVLKVEVKDSTGRTFNHSVDLPNQEKG